MSNEQMAQSILQFTGGKGNIRIVSNCMTRVRLEVNDLSVVQIDQIKALKGVFGVHVDAQVQVIVGPGTAAKVAACLQELLGDAHKAAGQADKETAQEIAARNKQVIKSRQKVSKGKLFLKTISNVFVPLSSALIASGLLAGIQSFWCRSPPPVRWKAPPPSNPSSRSCVSSRPVCCRTWSSMWV